MNVHKKIYPPEKKNLEQKFKGKENQLNWKHARYYYRNNYYT